MKPADPADRRWHGCVTAGLLLATVLPYAWARLTRPAGTTFVWALGFLPDTLGNGAFTRQAADGALLFADPFTAEPHPSRFFNPLFLLQGWLQRATGLGPGEVFQLTRIAAGAALCMALAHLVASLFSSRTDRRWAFLFVSLTGGLGFLAPWLPATGGAADVNGAECTTFFSLYQQAHFTAALALIAVIARTLPDALERGAWRPAAIAGLAHLALDAIHPYDAPVPMAACAVLAAWRRRTGRTAGILPLALFILPPLPVLAWNGWQAAFVPVYRDFAREGLLAAPWPLARYVLGLGALLPLAALGLGQAAADRDGRWMFAAAWVLVVPLLMACPLPARRKLFEGFHLFVALLAARGALAFRPALGPRWRPVATAGLAVLSLSGVFVMARDVYAVALSRRPARSEVRLRDGAIEFPFHGALDRLFAGSPWMGGILLRGVDRYDLPDDLLTVLGVAARTLPQGTVVLAAPSTGLFVPMFAPCRVVAGHLFGTLNMEDKELGIRAAMDARLSEAARRELVSAVLGAGALLVDERLLELGDWRPGREPWLAPAGAAGAVRLYRVMPAPPVAEVLRTALHADIDAGYLKAAGSQLLDAGRPEEAQARLIGAIQLRPDDPGLRALLSAARMRRSGRPPRPGTRNSG